MNKKVLEVTKKDKVLEIFTKHNAKLYSVFEIVDKLKMDQTPVNYKNIENIVRNLRTRDVVCRHKERDSNGDFQYAVKIKTSDIEPWVFNTNVSNGLKGTSKKTSRNKLLSKKEIQSMFAAQYNTLAKLEDEAMKIIEAFESVQKEMLKIRNFIGK